MNTPNHSSPYYNSSKRSRLSTNASKLQSLSDTEELENSSYIFTRLPIVDDYVEMSSEELQTWQQLVINKCLHENKVNYLLEQLKNMDPNSFNYPTRFYSNGVMGRTRSLSFEECAISMAIDNCGLQQTTSGSDVVLDSIRSDSIEFNDSNDVVRPPEPIDHSNFIEAAVAVAIQEKGLSPSNIQVSPNR